jgi:hypothetical protein
MNTVRATNQAPEGRKPQPELQSQYGRIAISAVVAALPYGTDTKKPAYKAVEGRD